MTHIEQMIKDMCPNGVEFKTLGEVCKIERGVRVVRNELQNEGDIPVYQNSLTPLGYYHLSNTPAYTTFVISAGAAGKVGFSNIPFWAADDCLRITCPNYFNSRFLYYLLTRQQDYLLSQVRHASVPRMSKEVVAKLSIPLPPLEIQKKIVECLDKFSALAAELQAELQKRRTQYEYYRTRLLTPPQNISPEGSTDDRNWEWTRLGDLCRIRTGKLNANAQVENGEYPFFTCDANPFKIDTYAFDTEAILISGNGSQVGHLNYYKGKFNAYQRTYVLDCFDTANIFYILHYMKGTLRDYIIDNSRKGSIPYITLPMLTDFLIPLLPLAEQARIVAILDKFETLTTSLSDGIPAEQAAQQKRYEYYRDLLLTFPKAEK